MWQKVLERFVDGRLYEVRNFFSCQLSESQIRTPTVYQLRAIYVHFEENSKFGMRDEREHTTRTKRHFSIINQNTSLQIKGCLQDEMTNPVAVNQNDKFKA